MRGAASDTCVTWPEDQPGPHWQTDPISTPALMSTSAGVQILPGPQSPSASHSLQIPSSNRPMTSDTAQVPEAHACAPSGASEQPWSFATEPGALHTNTPVKSGRS